MTPMTPTDKQEILNSYKWIKVPKLAITDDMSCEEKYRALEEHHIAETTFLISKVRELVQQIPTETI